MTEGKKKKKRETLTLMHTSHQEKICYCQSGNIEKEQSDLKNHSKAVKLWEKAHTRQSF